MGDHIRKRSCFRKQPIEQTDGKLPKSETWHQDLSDGASDGSNSCLMPVSPAHHLARNLVPVALNRCGGLQRLEKGGHESHAEIVPPACTELHPGKIAPMSNTQLTQDGLRYLSLPETMAMTGHQSVATVMGYFRSESSLNSRTSRMLDEE